MTSVRVGNVEIVALLDLNVAFPLSAVFPGVSADKWPPYVEMYPRTSKDGTFLTNFQAFAIRSAGRTLLVDAGAGPGPHEMAGGASGQLMSDMRAKGVDPESIETVIFTHLHFDHVGWCYVDGKSTFSRARILAPEADWALLGSGAPGFPGKEALEPLQSAGKLDLVSGEKQVTPEITIVPTPGHTPGHQSIVVASAGERAFVGGDVFAHPAQLQEVEWTFGFDGDPAATVATHRRVAERLEQEGGVVAFAHFPAPGFGRVVRVEGKRVFRAL